MALTSSIRPERTLTIRQCDAGEYYAEGYIAEWTESDIDDIGLVAHSAVFAADAESQEGALDNLMTFMLEFFEQRRPGAKMDREQYGAVHVCRGPVVELDD